MATLPALEQKIKNHIKDSENKIKLFRMELEVLKHSSHYNKPEKNNKSSFESKKAKPKSKEDNNLKNDPLASKIKRHLSVEKGSVKTMNSLHRSIGDNKKSGKDNVSSADSIIFKMPEINTKEMKIDYKGSLTTINCCPLKLVQFLLLELKTRLKAFVVDDENISKMFSEINNALEEIFREKNTEQSILSSLKNGTTQTEFENGQTMNEKHLISEEIQTDIYGFQLENLQSFQDTLLSNKLNLDVKLKQIEDMLETGLFKKNEVIEKLNSEIASMRIISEETNAMQKVMTDHVGLTLQEIQKDIKNLEKNIEKQSVIEDVQVELAQTNKKLMDVKRKCMKTSRQCLLMQFESLVMNSPPSNTHRIERELDSIKANLFQNIETLKCSLSIHSSKHSRHKINSHPSSSFASLNTNRESFSESLQTWNEIFSNTSDDDKFSMITLIDDRKECKLEGNFEKI